MNGPIQFPATLHSARRHADKSISVTHRSNFEMSTEDFAEIDRLLGTAGWSLFAPNELQGEDIPSEPATSQEGKSKGSRMRAVWFLKWKKRRIDEPFDPWYDRIFESHMEKWKEELQ